MAAQPSAPAGPEGWIPGSLYGSSPQPPPLFGWYPDPTGRHEERYWDGRHWSDRVADNSVRGDDPLHSDPPSPSAESRDADVVGDDGDPGDEEPAEESERSADGLDDDAPSGADPP